MSRLILVVLGSVLAQSAWAAPNHVTIQKDDAGYKLLVDGEPTFVRGMNWGYMPIGENYRYAFWDKPDEFIEAVLRREMGQLKAAGVNSIRQYPDIPARWVEWIWTNYGISTMVNPLLGRYGVTINGRFVPVTDYSDPATRAAILEQTLADVERYKDTPGVLFWLLGNENNYGLHWSGFEIQNLPEGEQGAARARYLYTLVEEVTDAIHAVDPHRPVAFANGDLQYIDIIAEECQDLDILASNVYRGLTARDLYEEVEAKLGIPFVYSEFGADAYDAKADREDHITQARYLGAQWEDIYLNAYGRGPGNAIGGYVFQWSDGWWKYKQEENLDIHDTNASWSTDAYIEDWTADGFNMNEEWFGITAKGPVDADGHFEVFPRAAYYVLRDGWSIDPYAAETTPELIEAHFAAIEPGDYDQTYRSSLAIGQVQQLSRSFVSNVRMDMRAIASTSDQAVGAGKERLNYDHLESFYLEAAAAPSDAFRAELSVNILGNVPTNMIDEISYETRGRDLIGLDADGAEMDLSGLDRVRVYKATFAWEHEKFTLEGYFREGHYHWGEHGDLFGLYREAYYGPNLDIYNADVPLGMEFTGKRELDGLHMALGPQLYWGANPAAIGLYQKRVGPVSLAIAHQEDLAPQSQVSTSFAVPERVSRKSTLTMRWARGPAQLDLGGIMAGTERVGESFTYVEATPNAESYLDSGHHVIDDQIAMADTLGARAKLELEAGRVMLLADGSYKGLVSDGGVDTQPIFTGWTLRQSQRGNQVGGNLGLAVNFGNLQIAPNVLWQKPLVGPLPTVGDQWDASTGWYYPGLTPRNVIDDPFAVLENRETTGFELLLAFDPTPGTWMWAWDNDYREDAPFAAALDITYRMLPTSRDSNMGFLADGTMFSFDGAPPAQDLWDARFDAITNPGGDLKLLLGVYAGTNQSRGSDDRLITRYGGDLRLRWKSLAWDNQLKLNDWGPYDYHQDFNNTYPLQVMTNLSAGLQPPPLEGHSTRIGLSGKFRTTDEYSEDWSGDDGYELEIGTFVHVSL